MWQSLVEEAKGEREAIVFSFKRRVIVLGVLLLTGLLAWLVGLSVQLAKLTSDSVCRDHTGRPCVFPFIYNGTEHAACTVEDYQVRFNIMKNTKITLRGLCLAPAESCSIQLLYWGPLDPVKKLTIIKPNQKSST